MEYFIGGLIVAGIWFYFSNKGKVTSAVEHVLRTAADPWFKAQGFDTSTLRYQWYHQPQLVRNLHSSVLVGMGDRRGKSIGFCVEVDAGKGVVSEIFLSSTVASWHASASRTAIQTGQTLLETLKEMARIKGEIG
jgi:hypothetical protein